MKARLTCCVFLATIIGAFAQNVVTTAADGGAGSLRQIIATAASGSTITFDPSLSGQTITLTGGELLLNQSLTIDGSALANGITISGNNSSRVFETGSGTTCVFTRLALTHAFNSGLGGAILNGGTLTVNQCAISASSAGNAGGGLFSNGGAATLNATTLSTNSALFGGGIANNGGPLTLNQCTLSGNSATGNPNSSGGAISNGGGSATVTQCTISGNSASGSSSHGGGIDNTGSLTLSNTIVANNTAPASPDVSGSFTNNGGNLLTGNPLLSVLGSYGGPTQTMPPLSGSPAIDAGNDGAAAPFTYDQRGSGFTRISGPHVDIGAVEVSQPNNVVVSNNSDAASGSLRYALSHAPAGATITFDASLSGQTITLTSGELLLTQNVTIDASALVSGITVSGNNNSRVFEVASGTTCVLTSLTITNGSNSSNGGGVFNGGTLTLNRCILSSNSSPGGFGGAIYNNNASTLTLIQSTLSGNSASAGGGIFNNATVNLSGSTLSGNSATFGGGIANSAGAITLNQCTFSGNSATGNASSAGGAISNGGGSTSVTQCTISNNSASGSSSHGGGIDNNSTLTLSNTIVAGNTATTNSNISGTLTDNGGNFTSGNPMLSALGNYGGPTQTMPPLAGSPLIDGGNDATAASFTYDQRGPGHPRLLALHVDIGAVEVNFPANVVIMNNADSGSGSLRYALTHATAGSTITFDPSLSGQTIILTTGELPLNQNLTVDASALPAGLTISGNNISRVFNVSGGTTCVLTALIITHGTNSSTGGAILNGGTLTLNRCILSSNSTQSSGFAGAIYNNNASSLTLNQCTLSGNTATYGGGIFNNGGTVILNESTFSGNSANFGGGILNDSGTLSLRQCTFSGNSATGNPNSSGGAISNGGGTLTLTQSTVSGNSTGVDNSGGGPLTLTNTIVAGNTGNSIVGPYTDDGSNLILGNPMLATLGNYGGPTQTMPPLAYSPAIDTGNDADAAGITYDQRGPGYPRKLSTHVDIGAVEVYLPRDLIVNNADSGSGSLRYALAHATAGSTLTFDPSLSGQTITLTSGELLLSQNITIDASSLPAGLTIMGNNSSRAFNVSNGSTCILTAVTITGSSTGVMNAGTLTLNRCIVSNNLESGITNSGVLTLNQCTLSGNTGFLEGGAIANTNGGNCTLNQSTLSGNSSNYVGGAIYNHTGGNLTLNQSTLSGNSSANYGGAIYNDSGGTLTINQSTLSANSVSASNNPSSGGGIDNHGPLTLTNTIVANNTANTNPNLGGSFTDNGGNLLSGNPMLSALGNYGGPTQTMPPIAYSPAIDGGKDAAAASFTNDQRGSGYPRLLGLHVDIGAVEVNLPTNVVILNNADTGASSLRYALAHTAAGSTLTFDPTLSGQTITLTSGELLLAQNVTIDASTLSHGLTISGNNSSRVLNLSGGTTCSLTALTIVNGTNGTTGGAVLNGGTLTLNQCTLSNNSVTGPAASYGGAVYNNTGGTLTLNQCTLSSNSAIGNVGSSGGALYNSGGGTLTLNQCTLSGNLAYFAGGGIFNNGGALALTNCTLSLNSATGNSNSRGGGISGGTVALTNTIVAGNTAVTNANIFANISGNGGNLSSGNPMLASLGNYGGRTQTMPPLIGSPAIDTGNDTAAASFTYDQRGAGYLRIVGPHVDIGAYERGSLNSFNAWAVETTGTAAGGLSFTGIAPNGRTYGLNYALRGNPLAGSASLLPALSKSGNSHTVQFPYRPGATDLIYTVQRSSDLITWPEIYRFNPATNVVAVNGVTSSEDAINQIITITDPTTGQKLFWRVVILPAP